MKWLLLIACFLIAQSAEAGGYWITKFTETGFEATPGRVYVQLNKDPNDLGGIEENDQYINKRYSLRTFEIMHPDSARGFRDVRFYEETVSGSTYWVGSCDSANVVGMMLGSYGDQQRADALDITGYECTDYKDYDPIYFGYPFAVTLWSDDGRDDNVEFADTMAVYGVKGTFSLVGDRLDASTFMTTEEAKTSIVDGGHEVACHAFDYLFEMPDYKPGPYLWGGTEMAVLRPTGSVSAGFTTTQTPFSGGNIHLNYDEPAYGDYDTDGFRSFGYRAAATTNVGDRLSITIPTAYDTLRATIDSVAVVGVFYFPGTATADSATARIRYYSQGSTLISNGYLPISPERNETNRWTLKRVVWADDNGAPWYWEDVALMEPLVQIGNLNPNGGSLTATWVEVYVTPGNTHGTHTQGPDTLLTQNIEDARTYLQAKLGGKIAVPMEGYVFPATAYDGRVTSRIAAAGYTYARGGVYSSAAPVIGTRQCGSQPTTWRHFYPYELTTGFSRSQLVGASATYSLAQVDSAVTAMIDTLEAWGTHAQADLSGNKDVWANAWVYIAFHLDTEITTAQLGQIIRTLLSDGRVYVGPARNVVENRDRGFKRE